MALRNTTPVTVEIELVKTCTFVDPTISSNQDLTYLNDTTALYGHHTSSTGNNILELTFSGHSADCSADIDLIMANDDVLGGEFNWSLALFKLQVYFEFSSSEGF